MGSPGERSRSPRASRTSPSSSRWRTGPTASKRRWRWGAAAPGSSSTPRSSRSSSADAEKVFHQLDELDSWDAVIDGEPGLTRTLSAEECDEALAAIARFVDLKSPSTLGPLGGGRRAGRGGRRRPGSARGGAAARAPGRAGRRLRPARRLERDLGQAGPAQRRGVGTGPPVPALHRADAAPVRRRSRARAGSPVRSRERLDGSGYPGGLGGSALGLTSRIVPPPTRSRPSASRGRTGRALRRRGRRGPARTRSGPAGWTARSSTPCCAPRASGSAAVAEGPAGLTAREIEVLQCLARGLSNKEIAQALVISPKTVGNHVEHVYTKIGASNRAAASLYAMRHGLLPEHADCEDAALVERPDQQLGRHAGGQRRAAGSSVNRNASPSCRGSASEERSSAPRPTKTWVRGAGGDGDGLAGRRAGPQRTPRPALVRPRGPARRRQLGRRDLVRRLALGLRRGEPDLDEPGLRRRGDLAWVDARRRCGAPRPGRARPRAGAGRAVGASSAPEITQVTMARSRVLVRREALARPQQVVVVADHRAEPHVRPRRTTSRTRTRAP